MIDEAAMASTRGLVPLLDAAHDGGAKVVMVGDPRQLDAIDAGGLLNGLAHRLPPITLTENRRQQHAWEREALADLRAGRIADALDGYNTHDRVLVADTAIDVRNHMAADWHAATLAGDHVLMLAERHYDVDDLNQRARSTSPATAPSPDLPSHIDDLTFQAGDRVLCLRNDRRIGVRNGTIGTVTDIDTEHRVDHDPHRRWHHARTSGPLPRRRPRPLRLRAHHPQKPRHHRRPLPRPRQRHPRPPSRLHRALTRPQRQPHLPRRPTTHRSRSPPPRPRHPRPQHPTRQSAATRPAERLAIDHHVHLDALRTELHDLHAGRSSLLSVRDAMPPDRTADIDALTSTHEQLLTQHADVDERLQHARPSLRHRRERLVQHLAAERALDHAAAGLARVEHALTHATVEQRAHDQYRHDHQPDLDRLTTIEERISHRLDQLVDASTEHPPTYLEQLGPPPPVDGEQRLWRHAADLIERYRSEHHITDPRHVLGTEPSDPDANEAWRTATQQLRFYCTRLTTLPPVEHTIEPDRGLDLGIDL